MLDAENHDVRAEAQSLIGWWRDAGVDVLIDEAPRNWLADATPEPAPKPAVAAASLALTAPPLRMVPATNTLAEFVAWFMTDTDLLANYPVRQRLAPAGDAANAPMIVTDVPERGDADAGHLLSGDVGQLFDRMIAAWKIDRSRIYLTAMAPARPARGSIDATALEILGPALVRHIRLAAPKKLWLMGEAASRAVLGMNVAEATGRIHVVNYDGVTVEGIATLHPRVLLREPKSKARVWEDMQRLIGDVKA